MNEGLTGLNDTRVINDRMFIFGWTIPLMITNENYFSQYLIITFLIKKEITINQLTEHCFWQMHTISVSQLHII